MRSQEEAKWAFRYFLCAGTRLCEFFVRFVSIVVKVRGPPGWPWDKRLHHRGTEDAEYAQRRMKNCKSRVNLGHMK